MKALLAEPNLNKTGGGNVTFKTGGTLKQESVSSVQSDSEIELIKKMPILEAKYNFSSTAAYSSNIYASHTMKLSPSVASKELVPSAGQVLLDLNFTKDNDLKETSNGNASSNDIANLKESKKSEDVVDSVPTREGRNPYDEKGKCEPYTNETPHMSNNQIPEDRTSLESHKQCLCCSTCCALFSMKDVLNSYTIIDLIFNIGSIGLFIFDLVTDWLNAFGYLDRLEQDPYNKFYFALTAFVIVLPSIVMHLFSGWWEYEDNQYIKKEKTRQNVKTGMGCWYYLWVITSHVLQIGPIYRYIRTMYYGILSRKKQKMGQKGKWKFYNDKYKAELADVNFIRMMESFLEAAPQLVLQIFIMIITMQTPLITVISCCVSLFGMSVAFVAYERALRNTLRNKKQLSIIATVVLFLYRTFTISSRVFALALLLDIDLSVWIVLFIGHWVLMTILIAWQKTTFCSTTAKEYVYDFVIGFCYNFAYIRVHHDAYNRCRMLAYYILMFLENIAIMACWFYFRDGGSSILIVLLGKNETNPDTTISAPTNDVLSNEIALALVFGVIGLFLLGILFLLIYYITFHPMATGINCCLKDTVSAENNNENLRLKAPSRGVERPPVGDNYRTNRKASQFRSWHSASLHCNAAENSSESAIKKRPSSEIITPSPSMLYEKAEGATTNSKEHRFSSTFDVQAATCSCYSLTHNLADYDSMKKAAHGSRGRAVQPITQTLSHTQHCSDLSPTSSFKTDKISTYDEVDFKRECVSRLIEQKQRQKREIERQQAQIRLNMEKMQSGYLHLSSLQRNSSFSDILDRDVFNRKMRARYLYSQPKLMTYIETGEAQKNGNQNCSDKLDSVVDYSNPEYRIHARRLPTSEVKNNGNHYCAEKSNVVNHNTQEYRMHAGRLLTTKMKNDPIQNVPEIAASTIGDSISEYHTHGRKLQSSKESYPGMQLTAHGSNLHVSGTFPRRVQPKLTPRGSTGAEPSQLMHSLIPITENKLLCHTSAARSYSISLTNLALSRQQRQSNCVPRASSFAVHKDEVVESIESSL